ncbi:Fic family protein [Rhodococcus sp. BS-15]|uniref:Fic family protein n=1 Tax=Rhodococcus sp. BS-15 TaxID=1304954 RepID=UPI0035B55F09
MRAIEVALDSQADVRKIHQGLLNRHRPHRAGRWRQHQIWTDPTGSAIDTFGYVPPRHERVAGAMEDLAEYARDSAGQPIATAAVAYAQFMSIQPFAEGNGRAGRALISHLLRQWGCVRGVAVPISVGINAASPDHSLVVDAFRGGDPVPVISSVAHAVIDGVSEIATLVDQLQCELQRMSDVLRSVSSRASRADSYSWPMLTYLLGQPVITTGRAGRALGTDRISGHKAATKLAEAGLIVPFDVASHIPVWQAPGVLEIWSRQGENRRRERRGLNDVA